MARDRVEPTPRTELARINDLTIDFPGDAGWSNVLDAVDLVIDRGESVGLVGESGCGKTTTAFSLLGYRRPGSRIRRGSVRFLGRELLDSGRRDLERVRGREIGFVPQNPTVTLNPRMRVGDQITETLRWHGVAASRAARQARMRELLTRVGLPPSARSDHAFPHQLSGGQQQRVMIALALACEPKLVVLDEPTTGLDVTTQAQILELLGALREELDMALLYVTHDLAVIAEVCDRVCVMYAGHIVEEAPTQEAFQRPRHPYTRGLIAAVPTLDEADRGRLRPLRGLLQRDELPVGCRFAPRCEFAMQRCFAEHQPLDTLTTDHKVACWRMEEVPELAAEVEAEVEPYESASTELGQRILDVADLDCSYDVGRRSSFISRRAVTLVVRGVSLDIRQGETLGLVGESGSGKSTIARFLAGLHVPVNGGLRYDEQSVPWPVKQRSKDILREIQLVLQNPDASLNPRKRVAEIVGRPLELFYALRGQGRASRIAQLLEDVRLGAHFASRYPDELSGGERQRVAIARALAAEPRLMLCDEVLSALDVSVQAEILDLMRRLQARDRMAYLFISHDLAVVRSIAHRVSVLYKGQLCEVGTTEEVFAPPSHPYTSLLLSSVPGTTTKHEHSTAEASPKAALGNGHAGCSFASRCTLKQGTMCESTPPPWQRVSETHAIRCHVPLPQLLEMPGH